MHSFIQRNKKKLLAVFGVMLMVIFLLPSTPGLRGNDPADQPYGKAGDQTITRAEVEQAKIDLDELKSIGFEPMRNLAITTEGLAIQALDKDPYLFVLLQHEAVAAGVAPPQEAVEQLVNDHMMLYAQRWATMRSKGADDKRAAIMANSTEMAKAADALRGSVRRFLLVQYNFARAAAAVKVTPPQLREQLASAQGPVVNVVSFSTSDYLKDVPPPTTQRVVAHYNAYADKIAGELPANNPTTRPAEFGYRQPASARLQYIALPRKNVVKSVVDKLSSDELIALDDVAKGYYTTHTQEFMTLPPAEPEVVGPTTASTQAATAPSAGPTTKPFYEVQDDLRQRIALGQDPGMGAAARPGTPEAAKVQAVQEKVKKEATRLQDELRSRLLIDFGHYKAGRELSFAVKPTVAPATRPASGPATRSAEGPVVGPASSPASGPSVSPASAPAEQGPFTRPAEFYTSLDYLEAVSADFRHAYGVATTVSQIGKEATQSDLEKDVTLGFTQTAEGTRFPTLVMMTQEAKPQSQPAPSPTVTTAATTVPATGPATAPTTGESAASQPAAMAPSAAISTEPTRSAWALCEPLPVLRDDEGDGYIARLTKYQGAKAPTLEEVRPKIEEDLKKLAAAAAAEAAARQFQGAIASPAQNHAEGGAPIIAADSNQKVTVVGPISAQSAMISDFPMEQASTLRFKAAAMSLRNEASPSQLHPARVVPLPADQKVVVLELRGLRRNWEQPEDFINQLRLADQLLARQTADVAATWFDSKSIIERTKFTPSR